MNWCLRQISGWFEFWEKPGSALDLGIARFCFFSICFYYYQGVNLGLGMAIPPEGWKPLWHLSFLSSPLERGSIQLLNSIFLGLLICCAAGFLTRFVIPLTIVVACMLLGSGASFPIFSHLHYFTTTVMLAFLFSPCEDCFSVDAWLWKKKASPHPSAYYGITLRLLQFILLITFFAAGASKLRSSGFAWANGENIRHIILYTLVNKPNGYTVNYDLSIAIAKIPELCQALAILILTMEIFAPMAMFCRRFALFFLPFMAIFQIANHFVLSVSFLPMAGLYAAWVPWRKVIISASSVNFYRRIIRP